MATFPLIHPKEKEHINDSEISAHDQQVHKVLENAAITIQKNYRGYRARRQLNGLGLSTATRWTEALKEAKFRERTRPLSPEETKSRSQSRKSHEHARDNWRRAVASARHAAGDDTSDTDGDEGMTPEQLKAYKARKMEAKRQLDKSGKMMDLAYWLEMVDTKHRYGSNLRAYHNEWKKADTHENFFYWLDHGYGRAIELPTVSRERLENEQIRYLSREERLKYLVRVDEDGRLSWAKDGKRISTTPHFKDSIEGIVPEEDSTPTWSAKEANTRPLTSSSGNSSASTTSLAAEEAQHYTNDELQKTKGVRKWMKVSPSVILNQLLRNTTKPNTWIFVADTSFHLYIGIKKSGAFQHSSFLQGARISAAGLIKIKDGQLRKLSPLSGHYRPPTKNFRLFVHSMRDAGVDMSRVSISRSYAVLVGLEAYVRTRKKVKHGIEHVHHGKEKVLHPEEAKKRDEEAIDKSKSAQREREVVRQQMEEREKTKRKMSLTERLKHKIGLHKMDAKPQPAMSENQILTEPNARPQKDDQDMESAIPPTGSR